MSTVLPRLFRPSCSAWIVNGRLRIAAAYSLSLRHRFQAQLAAADGFTM